VIVAHIMGIPIEESVLQLAPAGAAIATTIAIAARAGLARLSRRLRRRQSSAAQGISDARAAGLQARRSGMEEVETSTIPEGRGS
jgi:hypothetical protein